MVSTRTSLLVLDGQGVVFNAPFRLFLNEFSLKLGVSRWHIIRRWKSEIRSLAWSGKISDDGELWNKLAGKDVDGATVTASLEARYKPGPAFAHIEKWSAVVPIWLLSNHRSHWLLPRLERFQVSRYFQKVLVSDLTGALKPSESAFQPALSVTADPGEIVFVDDQIQNIMTAKKLGIRTVFANPKRQWLSEVDRALNL